MADKTRPGADRIARQELQAAAVTAECLMHHHLAQCYVCQRAKNIVRQRCGEWWRLARIAHNARRALRAWQTPETEGMEPLFTEEACDPPPF